MKTVNMTEIAQKLGVSSSTISRALREDPRIGRETQEKVRQMAAALGYRPNPLVSALMANRRRRGGRGEIDVIALVTHYTSGADWRTKDVCRWEYEGLARRAAELGFRIEVFPLADYAGNGQRLAATLRARGIRGVLLGFSREGDQPVAFETEGFAVAGLSAYFRSVVVDRANFHGFFNVQLALEKLWEAGYRRPALIVPELNNRLSNSLWSGAFLDWQRRLDPAARCELLTPQKAVTQAEFDEWLDRNRPDALLVYKVPVRTFLARRKMRVPEDIGLAYLYRTSDEMDAAGVDGNLAMVGAAALDLVVEKLNANRVGVSAHPKEVLIKGTWKTGNSLGQPPAGSPSISPAGADD